MNWLWISGWAVPPAWLAAHAHAAWPHDKHVAVSPSGAADALAKENFDAIGGYSLGALWLLKHAAQIPANKPVALLAPIFAFASEAGRGGKFSRAQLRLQRRRLRQDPHAAVREFLERAGLGDAILAQSATELTPARIAELDTELTWLEDWQITTPPPPHWHGFVGDRDPLLEATALHAQWPALQIVPGATHVPLNLLGAWEGERPASRPDRPLPPTIASFHRAAATYDAHAAPQAALAATLAAWIAPEERRGSAVEFGAGTGLFTRHLQPWAGTYVATDPAPAMVACGRERCPAVTWQQAEADFRDFGSTDWIFACNVLQWIADPAATLRRWHGLLAPGGQFAAAIFLRGTLQELQAVLPQAPTLTWRTAEEWQALLTQAGFQITRAETWEQASTHASALALLRSLHAMGLAPHATTGAGTLRAALRAYDQQFATRGGVHATWRALLVRASV